jgi:hypothetical protein
MANLDTKIVLSTEGNGGTMLLCSTLKLMAGEQSSQYMFFTGDHYTQLAQMHTDDFIQLCEPYRFVVFDNIEYGCSKLNQWQEKEFETLKRSGKKSLTT